MTDNEDMTFEGIEPAGDGEWWLDIWDMYAYVTSKIARLRLGVYDEERDGDLLAVLEEIERILA